MLPTILVTIFVLACLMALMAIGVVFQGRRLAGSCGGNPDSPNCRCSPEKRERCRVSASAVVDDSEIFALPPLSEETLAPPGEERLIQLRNHAGE